MDYHETIEDEFRIHSVDRDTVWVKAKQFDYKTLTAIDTLENYYNNEKVHKKTERLTEGDHIKAEIRATNPLCTHWVFHSIERLE